MSPDPLNAGKAAPFSSRTVQNWWRPAVDAIRRPSGTRTIRGVCGGSRARARRKGMSRTYAFDRHDVGLRGTQKRGVRPDWPAVPDVPDFATSANAVGLPGFTA